ncbi:TetR family transcriptional regulator [Actinoplanes xinjiangensis]|uniref:TetR family transcriptional regulator n=2 Tax=Actinoplanes xinjiangensis TaxID=512350 RepID=A0A316F422_9ACTN|nr:TetR family transcriptional regulator [Actinoplanes xinjiangensis]GIF42514.1 TetR family transcriptional regulator [Actinoplanes xinjiangensis]
MEMVERRARKPPATRLTVADWTGAALEAMARGGLAAVAVEPLAAALGATKGSFYWHFANRDALIEAALQRWETDHTDAVITMVEAEPDPQARLRTLIGAVIESTAIPGADAIELAMLATADHPHVAPVLARVTQRRLAYTAQLFEGLGLDPDEAADRALIAVSTYLGHAQLAHATPELVPGTPELRRRYVDRIIGLVTAV